MFIYTRTSLFFKYPRGLGQTAPICFVSETIAINCLLLIDVQLSALNLLRCVQIHRGNGVVVTDLFGAHMM